MMLVEPAAVGEAFNLSGPTPFSYDQVIPHLADKAGFPFIDARIPGPSIRIHHSTAKASMQVVGRSATATHGADQMAYMQIVSVIVAWPVHRLTQK